MSGSPSKYFGRLAAVIIIMAALSAEAQFYAPKTQFHDVSQRHFAVEAARVLAWLDHQRGVPVTEMTFALQKSGVDTNVWLIRWLNVDGKELRTATVLYSTGALTNGIQFYRDIFRQLCGSTNQLIAGTVTSESLVKAYWEGANRAGYSRMESVEAAFDLWKLPKGQAPNAEQAISLSGLLAQTTTHGFWQSSALDGRLLARAAAWLCVAESCGATNDTLWAPLLFVAGREWQARAVWSPCSNPPVAVWWQTLISGLPANEALVFIATPEQRSRAMPMMAWQGNISDGYKIAAGNLIQPIFGQPGNEALRLYDYAPGFADSSIENGHILNGRWPALARAAWIKALRSYPAEDYDYHGYTETARKSDQSLKQDSGLLSRLSAVVAKPPADNSTRNLDSASALLRQAYDESVGSLTPVAHVTSRDLMHYGWENAALQLAARHYFVKTKWGVPELAGDILQAATNQIPLFGLLMSGSTNSPQLAVALDRLQYVNWTFGGHWPAAGFKTGNILTNDTSGMLTHWLNPSMASWLYNWWFWAHTPEQRRPFMTALRDQGSRRMNLKLLEFLSGDGDNLQELRDVGCTLTNGLPLATGLLWNFQTRLAVTSPMPVVPTPDQCRQAERWFWSNPNSTLAPKVFHMYLLAGEFPAAKIFYQEAVSLPYDAVSYSMRMESPRWILAMFDGDKKTMRQVLAEHSTGSFLDYLVRINDALYQRDYLLAETLVQEGIERYGKDTSSNPSSLEILRRVLSSREALADPANPGHAHALGYLVNVTTLPVAQWLLIQNLKLSQPDAVTFLGGQKATGIRKLMIHYLRREPEAFNQALNQLPQPIRPSSCAIAGWLRADLFNYSPTLDAMTIRPPDAMPIEELVQRRLQQGEKK